MFQSVHRYLVEAKLDDPVVCYQGAVVAEPESGRFLRHVPIPLELAREAIGGLERDGWPIMTVHPVGPLLDWLEEPPTKLVVVGEPHALDELEVRMKAEFGRRMFISKSLPYFLELANREVSKGSGLAFLAEHVGFAPERTVGIGDGENDRELLDWAGYAVAVENAHTDLLARADLVIPGPDEEGVAQLIEAYLDSRA